MKMRTEHYERLRKSILANSKAPCLPEYLAKGLTEKRWRWDLLWATVSSQWICDNLYPYLNDDHIDTALKAITKG
jgi:hypothetical protein